MPGVNRYRQAIDSSSYSVLSESALDQIIRNKSKIQVTRKPCIFLSHKSEDKEAVKEIGNYIVTNYDIDIYLDIEDSALQRAVKNNDHEIITKSIEVGLLYSSHLMAVISKKTKNSWWVPYEIGFAKSIDTIISSLQLIDVDYLPSFLNITKKLKNVRDLKLYLSQIQVKSDPFELIQEVCKRLDIIISDQSSSVLSKYLDA